MFPPRPALVELLEPRRLMAAGTLSEQVIVDQFGYRADATTKIAIFADPITGQNAAVSYTPGATFELRRAGDDGVAFTGNIVAWKNGAVDAVSGDKVWQGDFSAFKAAGEYYVYDRDRALRSYPFRIGNDVYNGVLRTAIRTFYYQRAGAAITAATGGNWTHAAGHVGPNQDRAAKLWNAGGPVAGGAARDVSGGWYDAGDYNKYVPYTTGVLWNLLSAHEWNPAAFGDDWTIPESGNGVPDVIDEVKYETDWLLKMQEPGGAVHNRVANATYDSGNSDPSTDLQPRFYTQTTTWATASFAASAAHASRAFAAYDAQYPGYAQALRAAAERAWAYLGATPAMTPAAGNDGVGRDGGGTGGGGTGGGNGGLAATEADSTADADKRLRVLAAAELYKTTGDGAYKAYFDANYKGADTAQNGFHPLRDGTPRFDASVATDLNRAYVTYATTAGATPAIVAEIRAALANNLTQSWLNLGEYAAGTDPYRAFMWEGHYSWGSNQTKAEWANVLTYAIRLNVGTAAQQAQAREAAEEYLHYFHGRNPLSTVYLSNMGEKGANLGGDKSVMQVYHSWFGDGSAKYDGATSQFGPVPGFLVGGPNKYFGGPANLSPPANQPAAKSFRDWNTGYPESSWEITEPAIYYESAYSLLLSQYASAPVAAALVVKQVLVNDGGVQRGRITGLTVTFDVPVTLEAGAFAIAGRNGAGSGTTLSWTNPQGGPTGLSDTWTVAFTGSPVVAGSLADGVYDFAVVAGKAHAGNVDGAALPADYKFSFHRLFGDDDGDGDVDAADLFQLRKTVNRTSVDPLYRWHFDYDASNVIDAADLFQIRKRARLEFKGY